MVNLPRLALRTLGKRLPTVEGSLRLRGVAGQIQIRRDRFGIPHIDAGNDADAWFAVGFCHGQDRTFQIETRLRLVRGTLSALLGPSGLPLDRLSRRIGFRHYGEAALAALSPEHRRLAEAYALGVTSGASDGLRRRPHEFALLRARPTPYQAADALGFLAFQAFALAANWDVELARLRVLTLDGIEALAALDPAYPEWQPAGWPMTPPSSPPPSAWAAPPTTGRWHRGAPEPAAPSWPTTHTCLRCSPRIGTCSTSPPPSGLWPEPPSPGLRRWRRGTTGTLPGG
jgi:acyl-homoserine lactone acylase PvdQ